MKLENSCFQFQTERSVERERDSVERRERFALRILEWQSSYDNIRTIKLHSLKLGAFGLAELKFLSCSFEVTFDKLIICSC